VSNASAIGRRGDAILVLNATLGRALGDRLAQGLPPETIVERTRREGLDLPDEVVDLFVWRDGSNPGHAMGSLWLLPGDYLLSLEEAPARYRPELNGTSRNRTGTATRRKTCKSASHQGFAYASLQVQSLSRLQVPNEFSPMRVVTPH